MLRLGARALQLRICRPGPAGWSFALRHSAWADVGIYLAFCLVQLAQRSAPHGAFWERK